MQAMLPALEKVPALNLPDPSSLSLAKPQLSGGGGLAGAAPPVSYAGGGTLAPNQALGVTHGQAPAQPQRYVDPTTGHVYMVAPAPDQAPGAAAAAAGGMTCAAGASLQAQAQIARSVAMANLAQARCLRLQGPD